MTPSPFRQVLVADDDEAFRELFRAALESRGHSVLVAADAAEALRLVLDAPVDVAILDNRFPNEGDGILLLGRIKARRPEVEVIVLTAFQDADSNHDAIRNGAHTYLAKSDSIERLRATVDHCLEVIELRRNQVRLLAELGERNAQLESVGQTLRQWNESLIARIRNYERRLGLADGADSGLLLDEDTRFVIRSFLHELNNRLMLLSPDYLRLLFSQQPAEPSRIDALADSLEHIQGISDDFRQLLARSGTEKSVQSAEVIATHAFKAARLLGQTRRVTLTFDAGTAPPSVSCNLHQIVCALFNLLKNAIDAVSGDPDAQARHVDLVVRRADRAVDFVVTNPGPELPAATREQMFEKYFTTKPDGQGIGLALTRRIVESHDGTIEFFRESGRNGFRIRLPIIVPEPAEPVAGDRRAPAAAPEIRS